ncbi:MAG: SPOR domain-containing protein [Rhizobacter sp.]
MGLLSIFKRAQKDGATADSASRSSPNTTSASAAPSVHQARTRARRRLIGASLLVLMGIVAFPILFESQPRPIPVDIPIDIPRAEDAPPLRIPPAVSSAPAPTIPPARSQVVVVEPAVPASSTAPATASTAKTTPAVVPSAAAEAASKAAAAKVVTDKDKADKEKADKSEKDKTKEAERASREAAQKASNEAARAKALLEGKDVKAKESSSDGSKKTAATAGRFVVQVGAYADADAAKDVRQKVEKLGFKTYTQVVETSSGSRTRVRVGPVESKEQADKVLERLKAAGVSAVVLTL